MTQPNAISIARWKAVSSPAPGGAPTSTITAVIGASRKRGRSAASSAVGPTARASTRTSGKGASPRRDTQAAPTIAPATVAISRSRPPPVCRETTLHDDDRADHRPLAFRQTRTPRRRRTPELPRGSSVPHAAKPAVEVGGASAGDLTKPKSRDTGIACRSGRRCRLSAG